MSNDADSLDLAVQHLLQAARQSDALQGLAEPKRTTVAHRLAQPIAPLWLLAPEPVATLLGGNWDHRLVTAAPLTSDEHVLLAGRITDVLGSGDRESLVAAVIAQVDAEGAFLDT